MNVSIRLFVILILFTLLSSCSMFETTETDLIVEYKENFNDSLDDFEDCRLDVNKKITKSFEIQSLLSQDERDLVKISKTWEVNWKKVSEEFDQLNSELNNIYKTADIYFQKLEERANGMSDKSMRNNQLDKIKHQRESWKEVYNFAYNKCDAFKQIIIKGNDYSRWFQTVSMDSDLDKKISELSEILENSRKLINTLKQTKLDGNNLLNGEYQPQTSKSVD